MKMRLNKEKNDRIIRAVKKSSKWIGPNNKAMEVRREEEIKMLN